MPTTEKQPLHIHSIRVENYMAAKLVDVTLDPEDNLVIVGGDNGMGKTSTLDAIWACLGGKPDIIKPIHEGEDKATITLNLGDIIATRRFWYGASGEIKSDLKVENSEGAVYKSPQALLDALLSKFGFDPFDITELKPKEQLERFKYSLAIDTSDLEARYKEAYDERTLVNRELKTLEAKFVGTNIDGDIPDEEVSVATLNEELSRAYDHNAECEKAAREADMAEHNLRTANTMIEAQRNTVTDLQKQLEAAQAKLANMQSQLPAIEGKAKEAREAADAMAKIDVTPLSEKIDNAEELNRAVRAKLALTAARKEWKEAEDKRVALDATLKQIEEEKRERIASAFKQAKIEGVTFDDDGVWVEKPNGRIPFAQENTANQIRIAVALAVRENPRLRIFRIRDGEKLTKKTLPLIREIAAEYDCQVFLEMAVTPEDVAAGYRTVSFLMEDGEVRPALQVVA